MAMVLRKGPIANMDGRQGGTIFRTDQCGEHAQAYPRLIKPRHPSASQSKIRRSFSHLWHYWWKKRLTSGQRSLWWVWSEQHPTRNKKGETVYLTAFNWFIKMNLTKLYHDQPPILIPPW